MLEAIVDPEVPPLPPHITLAQAKAFGRALPKDEHKGRIVRETLRQKADELLPGR